MEVAVSGDARLVVKSLYLELLVARTGSEAWSGRVESISCYKSSDGVVKK
jgi:hypothetical protein